jgi:pectate lyase
MKRRRTLLVSPVLLAACGSAQTAAAPPTPTAKPTVAARPAPTDDPIGFASVAPGTTGGRGGQVVAATTADDLRRYLISRDPLVIQVSGALALSGMTPVGSNKTILGIGADAKISNGGFNLSAVNNVVIRNLTFLTSPDDAINLENGSHHVWIDHNTIGQATDGGLDIKRESSYVTVSWNVFAQQSKTSLVGHDDNFQADRGKLKVTYHHNWFKGDQRQPRVRFGEVHVFNNYYDGVRSYGVASTQDAKVVVEGNVFKNVRQPALVGYEESGPGDLVERNNLYESSGTPQTRGEAFDPTAYYAFSLTPLSEVSGLVQAAAGAGKLRNA